MIDYLKGLPPPVADGYGFNPVSPLITTTMASGRTRTRRRFRGVPTHLSVTWLLSETEAGLFEAWFEYHLKSGSLWFGCPLKSPIGFEVLRSKFRDIYSGPVLIGGDIWQFTAELEVYKRPLYDEQWFTIAPEYLSQSDVFDISVNDKWPEFHEDPSQIILANDGVREDMKAWHQRPEYDE
ncbi:hypothetical protein [Pseudomonas hunanensis]|uniref:hypothetical protein n=1 Tax=Pseudomonas hunanensis TaxID=1247546 RepID=UPI00382D4414